MRRPDFEKCTAEATKLLHVQDVSKRILNIQNLVYDKNIVFDSIQNYSILTKTPLKKFLSKDKQVLKDGCTIYDKKNDCYIVLYNNDVKYFEHLNWTLGHEIGHIYMGHVTDGDIEEIEAHYFASQLFMPDYTLYMTKRIHKEITVEDITEIFGVSPAAAKKRLNTMTKRTCMCVSDKAIEIWESQRERVELYYKCKSTGTDYRTELEALLDMKEEFENECYSVMFRQLGYR